MANVHDNILLYLLYLFKSARLLNTLQEFKSSIRIESNLFFFADYLHYLLDHVIVNFFVSQFILNFD